MVFWAFKDVVIQSGLRLFQLFSDSDKSYPNSSEDYWFNNYDDQGLLNLNVLKSDLTHLNPRCNRSVFETRTSCDHTAGDMGICSAVPHGHAGPYQLQRAQLWGRLCNTLAW